jgi:SAM-dependent methyltransferase
MNINTKDYWDKRFSSGDWECKRGRVQTKQFAETQIKYFMIAPSFSGTILDFGCGTGDAIPVYREAYPQATLIGLDLSEAAIIKCRDFYGGLATFVQGNYTDVPEVDVIIASNVFEHLSNDIQIAAHLLNKCHDLFVITPYREAITPNMEHINSYDEGYFKTLGPYDYSTFYSKNWSQSGWKLWFNIYIKNLVRPFFGKNIEHRQKQIMFHFKSESNTQDKLSK